MNKFIRTKTLLTVLLVSVSAVWAAANSQVDASIERATEFMQAKKYEQAENLLKKVVTDHPDNAKAWFNLGLAQHLQAKYQKAVVSWEESLALNYDKATNHYNLACANARLGYKDKAFNHLEEAIAAGFRDPKSLENDSDLESLRSDKRWTALIAEIG